MDKTKFGLKPVVEERNAGIDLLRLVAMLMVVLLHCLNYGVGSGTVGDGTANEFIFNSLGELTKCAVDIFAIITGYVCVNASFRYSRIFPLWLQALIYDVGITAVFAAVYPGTIGLKSFLISLTPVPRYNYWYLTAYFCMFFFIPFFNMLLHRLGGRQNLLLVGTMLFVFSGVAVCGNAFGRDFGVKGGYSPLWLMVMYFVGAYLKLYGARLAKKMSRLRCVLGFLFGCGASWVCQAAIVRSGVDELFGRDISGVLAEYNSPFVVLSAVCAVMFFAQLKIKKGARLVTRLSACAFGVYLISEQRFFRHYIVTGRFVSIVNDSPLLFTAKLLGGALAIFVFCLAVDYLRSLLFKVLRVNKLCSKIDSFSAKRLPTLPY